MDRSARTNPFTFFLSAIVFLTATLFIALKIGFPDLNNLHSYGLAVNLALFTLIGYDKSCAGSRALRVPERICYAGAVLGGGLGIFLAMKFFRHKIRKAHFQFHLAVIICLQLLVLWLLTAAGVVALKTGGV